jgi:hypothetical protein
MLNRATHPDRALFDYLRGKPDQSSPDAFSPDSFSNVSVAQHVASCSECAVIAGIVSAARGIAASGVVRSDFDVHPASGELARFFYERGAVGSYATAVHVAECSECVSAIAEYARAENAAKQYRDERYIVGAVPEAAWIMIREWEDSSFAIPRTAGQTLSHETLSKLVGLLQDRRSQIDHLMRAAMMRSPEAERRPELVPVIIVDPQGEFRGVEMFHRLAGPGLHSLVHAQESNQFDNKPMHALLDFGPGDQVVVSKTVEACAARIRHDRATAEPRRADYFIVDE